MGFDVRDNTYFWRCEMSFVWRFDCVVGLLAQAVNRRFRPPDDVTKLGNLLP